MLAFDSALQCTLLSAFRQCAAMCVSWFKLQPPHLPPPLCGRSWVGSQKIDTDVTKKGRPAVFTASVQPFQHFYPFSSSSPSLLEKIILPGKRADDVKAWKGLIVLPVLWLERDH